MSHKTIATLMLFALGLAATACGKDKNTASASGTPSATPAPSASTTAVVAKPAGLGVQRDQFVATWNSCVDGLGENAGKLKLASLPAGDSWTVTFVPGLTLAGSFGGTNLKELVLTSGAEGIEGMILKRFGFSCLSKVTSPTSDDKELIKDLGMVSGTSKVAIRGRVTFGFDQEQGGPEVISVYETGATKPAAPAKAPAPVDNTAEKKACFEKCENAWATCSAVNLNNDIALEECNKTRGRCDLACGAR